MSSKKTKYITETEAAAILSMTQKSLANLRAVDRGPKWVRINKSVMYDINKVIEHKLNSGARGFFDRLDQPVALNWKAPKTTHNN